MDAEALRSLLPWRQPFLMVDRMKECVPHERIVTLKNVTCDDAIAPGSELPGTMVLEGMSQSAALLFQLSFGAIAPGRVPLLGSLKATWHAPARAGDVILFAVRAIKMTSTMGIFTGSALVEGSPIAEAELAFAVVDIDRAMGPAG